MITIASENLTLNTLFQTFLTGQIINGVKKKGGPQNMRK